ncbi:WD40-repeat-containing domain protein [Truncatella angustata]|uniref:WD40-repeat-containing domain protein n=1 Tax=Truncatella angustata TaxID=152316 RepID=A0A9P8UTS3_9PEZI|nr:WD40-repeat-containing domain protein [Truncatella angustata]KAH6658362.1 WD40-repeat-containing domain protein [Truncatella angustata]KAH8196182.1 hypothetical protein TruAng_009657 [Truncatella angustata]
MSSFFTVPGQKKRKGPPTTTDGPRKRPARDSKPSAKPPPRGAPQKQKPLRDDESISGSDESEDDRVIAGAEELDESSGSDSEKEGETAAEKRLRLAERYLDKLRREEQESNAVGFNAEDVDRDILADRLREDVATLKGKVYRKVADELDHYDATHSLFRADTLTSTAIATCAPFCYTVSKDRTLIKWRVQDLPKDQYKSKKGKKPPPKKRPEKVAILKPYNKAKKDKAWQGHIAGEIQCIAASQDGKFVVTGGTDRRLCIYDATTLKPIKAWTLHRDAVLALAFRRNSNQLYSASKDRTIKVWSLDDMAYIETLFGHADQIVDIDALAQERCVSVGARDRTARLWKVVEETQLVFRGGGSVDKKRLPNVDPRSIAVEGSMDRVSMLDEELFVTGSDNGSIALWSLQKKKPLFIMPQAHGLEIAMKPEEASAEVHPDPKLVPPPQPRWITALRTLPYSDVILSGSWDGTIKMWKLSDDKRSILPVGSLCEPNPRSSPEFNGVSEDSDDQKTNGALTGNEPWMIKGVINDISIFERGERGKDGLCVVVAVGKEHRLGKWKKVKGAKNGAVVFEIPRIQKQALTNGNSHGSE